MALLRMAMRCYLDEMSRCPSGSTFAPESPDGFVLTLIMRLNGATEVALRGKTVAFYMVRQYKDRVRILAVESKNMGDPVSFSYQRDDALFAGLETVSAETRLSLLAVIRDVSKHWKQCSAQPVDVDRADAVCAACGDWVSSTRPHRRIDPTTCAWVNMPAEFACEPDEYKRAQAARAEARSWQFLPEVPLSL